MKQEFTILMYSHDTYGLGHIRRTLAIAKALAAKATHILIITGSPLAGQFSLPRGVDFIRIPGMVKTEEGDYLPSNGGISREKVMKIRTQLILATIKNLEPDLFIVDKEPLGLKKEVLPGLVWIQNYLPRTRSILGLRDVMDEASIVKANWKEKKIFKYLARLYSEIWVYGEKKIYNPIVEYEIPEVIQKKIQFTGYIQRELPQGQELPQSLVSPGPRPRVLVTIGGGKDGFPLLDASLKIVEHAKKPLFFDLVLVAGPFLEDQVFQLLVQRAKMVGVPLFRFFDPLTSLMAASDSLVCMGGYNTLCEALSSHIPTLVVPRETPRKEQFIRARALRENDLLEFIVWDQLTPGLLEQKIDEVLALSTHFKACMTAFKMTGLEKILERVDGLKADGLKTAGFKGDLLQ